MFCSRLLDVVQKQCGNAQIAAAASDVDIRLVGPMKVGAAGGEQTVFDGQFLELSAFVLIVGRVVDFQAGQSVFF